MKILKRDYGNRGKRTGTSNYSQEFYGTAVLKKVSKFRGKYQHGAFFSRITVFQPSTFPKKTPLHEFSREFRDIFRSSFFKTHLCVTTSDEESILGIKNIVYVLSQLK